MSDQNAGADAAAASAGAPAGPTGVTGATSDAAGAAGSTGATGAIADNGSGGTLTGTEGATGDGAQAPEPDWRERRVASVRARLAGIRQQLVHGTNGDHRALAGAVGALVDLLDDEIAA